MTYMSHTHTHTLTDIDMRAYNLTRGNVDFRGYTIDVSNMLPLMRASRIDFSRSVFTPRALLAFADIRNVPVLVFANTNITNESIALLGNQKSINIDNTNITDISVFGYARKISMRNTCIDETQLQHIMHVRVIDIRGTCIRDTSTLLHVSKITTDHEICGVRSNWPPRIVRT